jgi:hypothetical protein
MTEVLYIVLGWLLGLLSPAIAERIRRHHREKDVIATVVGEFSELQFTFACAERRSIAAVPPPTATDRPGSHGRDNTSHGREVYSGWITGCRRGARPLLWRVADVERSRCGGAGGVVSLERQAAHARGSRPIHVDLDT